MFHVTSNIREGLLRFALSGMLDAETLAAYQQAMILEAAKFHAAGVRFDSLCDLTRFPPQLQQIAGANDDMMARLYELGARRCAIIVSNIITKLQVARIAGDREVGFFTSEADALAWLAEAAAAEETCARRASSL